MCLCLFLSIFTAADISYTFSFSANLLSSDYVTMFFLMLMCPLSIFYKEHNSLCMLCFFGPSSDSNLPHLFSMYMCVSFFSCQVSVVVLKYFSMKCDEFLSGKKHHLSCRALINHWPGAAPICLHH